MTTFRYNITSGPSRPVYRSVHKAVWGSYQGTTRRELIRLIEEHLEVAEMPQAAIRQVGIRRLWGLIKRYGSSSIHFRMEYADKNLSFHGLTAEEYQHECEAIRE